MLQHWAVSFWWHIKEPENEKPISMNILWAKGKEWHDAADLAVDRLAIVFTLLKENQFFNWRTSG